MNKFVALFLILAILTTCYMAGAEEKTMYVLCNPKPENRVCVRRFPKKGAEETGYLTCGDKVITDGKKRNGFVHIIGVTEDGEGWVHKGYLVEDRPVIEECWASIAASGRVKARRCVGGQKASWLDVLTEVKVYAHSEEWAVTSRGYIKKEFLEIWYEK